MVWIKHAWLQTTMPERALGSPTFRDGIKEEEPRMEDPEEGVGGEAGGKQDKT